MIKLTKSSEPSILATNKANWTAQLREFQITNQNVPESLATKYNHDDVKNALRTECHSKCMYCESKVEHISDLHIEHIKPKAKSKFPELTFEYGNLGLACPICNRNKADTYDKDIPFINPYEDDPGNHFYPIGAYVWGKAGDLRAKLTENEIALNRPDLIEARGERMKAIRELIDSFHTHQNPTIKASIKKQILKEVDKDKIYSFCCSALVDAIVV